jgi:hypothetical protein
MLLLLLLQLVVTGSLQHRLQGKCVYLQAQETRDSRELSTNPRLEVVLISSSGGALCAMGVES